MCSFPTIISHDDKQQQQHATPLFKRIKLDKKDTPSSRTRSNLVPTLHLYEQNDSLQTTTTTTSTTTATITTEHCNNTNTFELKDIEESTDGGTTNTSGSSSSGDSSNNVTAPEDNSRKRAHDYLENEFDSAESYSDKGSVNQEPPKKKLKTDAERSPSPIRTTYIEEVSTSRKLFTEQSETINPFENTSATEQSASDKNSKSKSRSRSRSQSQHESTPSSSRGLKKQTVAKKRGRPPKFPKTVPNSVIQIRKDTTSEELTKFTVVELRDYCRSIGLKPWGAKDKVIDRILQNLSSVGTSTAAALPDTEEEKDEGGDDNDQEDSADSEADD